MDQHDGILRSNWRTATACAAIVADTVLVVASLLGAAHVYRPDLTLAQLLVEYRWLLALSVLVFLGFFVSLGLYRMIGSLSFARQAFLAGRGYVCSAAVILSTLFLVQNLIYSRLLLLLFLTIYPLLYVFAWSLLRTWIRRLQRAGYGRWNTLAIGTKPYLDQLLARVQAAPELGYDIVKVITAHRGGNGEGELHVDREEVERILGERQVRLIAFSSAHLNGSFDRLEDLCRRNRVAMRVISPESDALFARARLHDIAGLPLYSPERPRLDRMKRFGKRAFDVVGASVGLLLFSPLFLVVAVATKIESRGPVFFKQKRSLSDDDAPFEFLKFRSMVDEADELKDTLLECNESDGALFKMRDDPRLTRVGRFLRRHSIDELPQLINVLRGDMSLVGPRPLPADDFRHMREEDHLGGYFRQRARARPGMTGLWQISGRSEIGFREMVMLDLYYIEHQTLLFDMEILAQTIPVVLFGSGAY